MLVMTGAGKHAMDQGERLWLAVHPGRQGDNRGSRMAGKGHTADAWHDGLPLAGPDPEESAKLIASGDCFPGHCGQPPYWNMDQSPVILAEQAFH